MAKKDPTEEAIARLATLRGQAASPQAREQLVVALQSKINLVAARAAGIAADMKFADLSGALETAFDRFMVNPGATDKQCAAKVAIVNAFDALNIKAQDIFLAGVKHIQMEPSWGGSEDSAVELRGRCAMALVNISYRDVLTILADLLADPAAPARIAAARAIAAAGRDEGMLLLRLKILTGDENPDVIAECIASLMSLSPRKSMPLVEKYLDDPDEAISQSAALSIGQSRLPEAFTILRGRHGKSLDPERASYLLPIAMTRLSEAVEFLFGEATEKPKSLPDILKALAIYRHDSGIVARLRQIVSARSDPVAQKLMDDLFGDG